MKALLEDPIGTINRTDKQITLAGILLALKELSNHPDAEIKIYERDILEYKLAITPGSATHWKIDYPLRLGKIHKQCYATKQKCAFILKKIYNNDNAESIKDFIDVPLRHFTLDEMLQFKKEDEMMLKGQDPY